MERLTIDEIIEHCERKTKFYEEVGKSIDFETIKLTDAIKEYWDHKQVKEYLEELKKYRCLEEQGLLLRLQFKIGQKVYYIYKSCIDRSLMIGSMIYSYSCLDFPREYFATKEEAEQKLKEMESD